MLKHSEMIDAIVKLEWPMFHTVNGEDHTACQEDPVTFDAMRRAQFSAWSQEAVEAYLRDLEQARAEGRNLVREKYIRMMETTDPEGYAFFRQELPPVSEEKQKLVAAIWEKMLIQTEKLRDAYPGLAMGSRPLRAGEAGESGGWASIETYQVGELMTYSEDTLRALLAHMEALQAQGIDLAREIQLNSVKCLGYASLEEADTAISFQLLQQFGSGCPSCGPVQ